MDIGQVSLDITKLLSDIEEMDDDSYNELYDITDGTIEDLIVKLTDVNDILEAEGW